MPKKKSILITGVNGFTGNYLSQELKSHEWDVWGLGNRSIQPIGSNYFQVDLLDTERLKKVINQIDPYAVVHLAAISYVGHGNTKEFYGNNVVASVSLLEAILASAKNIEKVVLASSANMYGNTGKSILSESDDYNPVNDYAASKASMEMVAKAWKNKLPIIITRPFNYTGRGQSENFLVPKIVSFFKRKAPFIELGNLDVSRDYSDVRDVAYFYRRILEAGRAGEIYNICSGSIVSLKEIVSIASELSGHELDVKVNPEFVRSNEIKELCGNPKKLNKIVGDFSRKTTTETISWMID